MASRTPRTITKEHLQNVRKKVVQKVMKRRSEAKLSASLTSGELAQSSSGKKQGLKEAEHPTSNSPQVQGSVGRGGTEEDATPRHIIQNMLTVQGTAQPVTRRKPRVLDAVMQPPISTSIRRTVRRRSSVSSDIDLDDVSKKLTPRTNILGFLDQAPEMTPAARQTLAASDIHSTTQNVSSCFTVNEVGVTLLEGNSTAEVNESASGSRFRSKKWNLNIQLPELSPKVLLTQIPLPSSTKSASINEAGQTVPSPTGSQPPPVQPTEEDAATRDIVNASVVSETDQTSTSEGNFVSEDALDSSVVSEGDKSKTIERNVFSDVFGDSGDGDQTEAVVSPSLPRNSAKREMEPVQGGRKGQTPSFVGRADSEKKSPIQGTPHSDRVRYTPSQTLLEAVWAPGKTLESAEGKAGNDGTGTDVSASDNNTRTLRRSIRNAENIMDATPASADKRVKNLTGASILDSPSSVSRSKKQLPGITMLNQTEGLAKSNHSQTLHSLQTPGSSRRDPRSQSQKGSSLKKQSGQESFQLSSNLSVNEDGLGENPVAGVLTRNTPVTSTPRVSHQPPPMMPTPGTVAGVLTRNTPMTSTPRVSHQPPPMMPTPGTSSSHNFSAFATSGDGHTPGSATSKGHGGIPEKNNQSSLQRRSRSTAVSRLSSRFDAVDSDPASARSGREESTELDTDKGHLLTSVLAETAHNVQMSDLMDMLPAQEDSSDEDGEEYSPLKTPKLPPKPSTPATVAPKSANRDKNTGTVVGAPRAGTKRKIITAPRPAKKPRSGLPTSAIKSLFGHFCHLRVSKEAIEEVERLSEQYWTNMAEDLEAYAAHAHRHTINESDIELLMKRQGFITDNCSLNTLVAKYLPLELRQELIPIARSGNALQPGT